MRIQSFEYASRRQLCTYKLARKRADFQLFDVVIITVKEPQDSCRKELSVMFEVRRLLCVLYFIFILLSNGTSFNPHLELSVDHGSVDFQVSLRAQLWTLVPGERRSVESEEGIVET
ncbi:hypothetical protein KC340_g110 [Hortaea werneckii]|nr:hypothetical protein KC340_g110 [Hortaea werneckii]